MLCAPRKGGRVLRIDLHRADCEPVDFSVPVVLPSASGGEDVADPGQAVLAGRVEKLETGYVVEASLEGAAQLRCVRCLNPFPLNYLERFRLVLQPLSQAPLEEETQLKAGELEVRFFVDPVLDLQELAVEQFHLALPMKPLCHQECPGLCPRCGADLNRGRCACPANADSRWESLRSWRPADRN